VIKESYLNITIREELQGLWVHVLGFLFLVSVLVNYQSLGMAFSELIIIVLVFQRLSPSFHAVQKSILDWRRDLPVYEAVSSYIQLIDGNLERHGRLKPSNGCDVVFHNVAFSYEPGKKWMCGVDLKLYPNKTTVVIGKSGAGKSTLIDMYMGLIRPSSGNIVYSGIDSDDIDFDFVRSKVAYVGQSVTLVDGNIYENLLLNTMMCDFTYQEIIDTLRLVGLADLDGYNGCVLDYEVGENGGNLSGGERQRLLLARALLRQPEVLILDEPTSSLDESSKELVLNVIDSLHGEITIVIVTHALDVVGLGDYVYEVQKGQIIDRTLSFQ